MSHGSTSIFQDQDLLQHEKKRKRYRSSLARNFVVSARVFRFIKHDKLVLPVFVYNN